MSILWALRFLAITKEFITNSLQRPFRGLIETRPAEAKCMLGI